MVVATQPMPQLVYARLGIFSKEDALNYTSSYPVRSVDPPFGDLCAWKLLPGYYCDGNTRYLCHCSFDNFPVPDCATVWHTTCPGGCVDNQCQDLKDVCGDGWVDDPTCADLGEEEMSECQQYFGTGEMCQLRKRQGSVYFAYNKGRIREQAVKAWRFFKDAKRNYLAILADDVMVDGYMKRTERSFACERAFPRCHENHYEGYQCDSQRHDHNDNMQALELICRRQNQQECHDAELLPKTVCNKSGGARSTLSWWVVVIIMLQIVF